MIRDGTYGGCLSIFTDYPTLHDLPQLRRKLRAQRRALSPKEQQANSQAMSKLLASSSAFRNSKKIALYLENDGEIAVSQLLSLIKCDKKRCYLPVLRPMLPNRLWFSEYRPGDRLTLNKYGIPEPDIRKRKPITPYGLDLVLMPLVAFDADHNRIGMGGGFYDRTFSYLKVRNSWRKPKLIGVAHELQKLNSIKNNSWDIQLDGVVTELKFYN